MKKLMFLSSRKYVNYSKRVKAIRGKMFCGLTFIAQNLS